ncbi:cilia- and flagella-associated protein 410-like isoform X2 [Tubulanus polymorphus]|uniref:cilia- and flagella-associated protein 410-like isoform X2 n=1 Tax=Tubulanus polymorphus TaxID=672921 RepID=UPI003DA66E45
MPKLTEDLVLARTRASDLESVKKLNCWASELDDIGIVSKMKQVEIVSLSVNSITTLQPFQYCRHLQELYIRRNKIASLSEICYLKKLPQLRTLWLADNPCAMGDGYRMTVLKALPNLQKLDNIPVQEEEINDAIEQGIELNLPHQLNENNKRRPKSAETSREEKITDHNTVTFAETNKIREQLGLKPLTADKMSPAKSKPQSSNSKAREKRRQNRK